MIAVNPGNPTVFPDSLDQEIFTENYLFCDNSKNKLCTPRYEPPILKHCSNLP